MRILTLGPPGTYSEKATKKWTNKNIKNPEIKLKSSPEEVINQINPKTIGILPIENSIQGTVLQTIDLLNQKNVKIMGETIIEINHCLIGHNTENTEIIVSHPQALAQCRNYITNKFSNAETRTTGSTAHAAKLTTEFTNMAAIAPAETAKKYNLNILEKNIQDVKQNKTRFIILATKDAEPTGNDKTTLIFSVKQKPGTLYKSLKPFAKRQINLTKLESRPSRKKLGDYYFIIDIEGHRKKPKIKKAIKELKKQTEQTKILGSYPKAKNQ
ncbi:Prephenate dehydratase [Methanonatronarchaeum thermophilum]|uniref:prephenate dehydratase n=1 Tax=Methanonatronarchaeum thermophilum TaxID=1927129 RepID=A0A1Y3GBE4_9EURY|nr:prephenate dehydratase [Methanonatronarchaeum thermophilum]OUJ18577.1 Prephenate dehydratase [Methanonatronarchaeum thermophilum]